MEQNDRKDLISVRWALTAVQTNSVARRPLEKMGNYFMAIKIKNFYQQQNISLPILNGFLPASHFLLLNERYFKSSQEVGFFLIPKISLEHKI